LARERYSYALCLVSENFFLMKPFKEGLKAFSTVIYVGIIHEAIKIISFIGCAGHSSALLLIPGIYLALKSHLHLCISESCVLFKS
jgi:hypothetical protein